MAHGSVGAKVLNPHSQFTLRLGSNRSRAKPWALLRQAFRRTIGTRSGGRPDQLLLATIRSFGMIRHLLLIAVLFLGWPAGGLASEAGEPAWLTLGGGEGPGQGRLVVLVSGDE